ncbi:MAG: PIN domain-containing protein [Verrucomicrobia bacterium]|jgi:predicted nucleic acid-binding protein|nr:PIN domain-containing protein [Verrucomicrobiota bacterium]
MKTIRIYVDTSIIGGCCDDEFADASWRLIRMVQNGKIVLMISALLADELENAPSSVKAILDDLPRQSLEFVDESSESRRLRNCYLAAKIVGPAHSTDAHHVALATVSYADLIVSWNFKHIVHYDKIRGFNAINLREGYPPIAIHSPFEVI